MISCGANDDWRNALKHVASVFAPLRDGMTTEMRGNWLIGLKRGDYNTASVARQSRGVNFVLEVLAKKKSCREYGRIFCDLNLLEFV